MRWGGLFLTVALLQAGCGSQSVPPPPDLPALATELPGPPPEPKPAVIDQVELELFSQEGERIEEIDQETLFRVLLRFHVVEPPEKGLSTARFRLVILSKGKSTTCASSSGPLISEGNNRYRCEVELKSSPYPGRQHLVRASLYPDQEVVAEKPLMVR